MPVERDASLSCNRERLDRVLGRLLRIEAERGSTFEELLAFCPRFERRLLDLTLAKLDSARRQPLSRQDIPAPAPEPRPVPASSNAGRSFVRSATRAAASI